MQTFIKIPISENFKYHDQDIQSVGDNPAKSISSMYIVHTLSRTIMSLVLALFLCIQMANSESGKRSMNSIKFRNTGSVDARER